MRLRRRAICCRKALREQRVVCELSLLNRLVQSQEVEVASRFLNSESFNRFWQEHNSRSSDASAQRRHDL
jgi:hypothetical protein